MARKIKRKQSIVGRTLDELKRAVELKRKIADLMEGRGVFTIPQLAKLTGGSEEEVADALYELCLPRPPVISIPSCMTKVEATYRDCVGKIIELIPEFTDKTEFYRKFQR